MLNLDEECLMASQGSLMIIAAFNKAKQELENANSRLSVTILRVGSAAGFQGPTFVLLKGKDVAAGFDEDFLVKHGAAPGSRIIMTPNAFMTHDAWDELAPHLAAGIRKMKIIEDHPNWHCKITGDGFGAHKMTVKAQEVLASANIQFIIEEGDSSHVNQPFDRTVAKNGKGTASEVLEQLRSTKACGTMLTQYHLVHVVLAMVRKIDTVEKDDNVWSKSFRACNLHPDHRMDFPHWVKKIENFLKAGSDFAAEGQLDRRNMLPEWWKIWCVLRCMHTCSYPYTCILMGMVVCGVAIHVYGCVLI